MTNTDAANASRTALIDLGWTVGAVETQPNGLPGYVVTQPYRVFGKGKSARVTPAQTQRRSFAVDGSMIVEVL
jgi:hypothetical protein